MRSRIKKRKQKKIELVNTQLEEVQRPKLKDLPLSEKHETNDKINSLIEKFEADNQLGKINPGVVGEMIALSEKLGNNIMWVYWQFAKKDIMVNVPLLWEIARQKKYKNNYWWVKKQSERIATIIENEKAKMKSYEEAGLFG